MSLIGYIYTTENSLYLVEVESVDNEGFRCLKHQEYDINMNYVGKIVDGGFFLWDKIDNFEKSENAFSTEYQRMYEDEDG